ncbi:MAG TPA: hypothetical protein IAC62_03405 [Candidatus Pelethocola excrementipullorum]|nr:hypothetical protein [Candidatus Pelethocola excrementipullorum]
MGRRIELREKMVSWIRRRPKWMRVFLYLVYYVLKMLYFGADDQDPWEEIMK